MRRPSSESRELDAAQRGQIIQRVLVDGWSAAEVAALFGLGERQVARWVAAYRRHGMASLRTNPGTDRWGWAHRLFMWIGASLRGTGRHSATARAIVLRCAGNIVRPISLAAPHPGTDDAIRR